MIDWINVCNRMLSITTLNNCKTKPPAVVKRFDRIRELSNFLEIHVIVDSVNGINYFLWKNLPLTVIET